MADEKVQVKGFADIPAPEPRTLEFTQNGRVFSLEFYPLTASEVEAIRASVPEPEAPMKDLPGKGAKDMAHLRQQGFPTKYKDVNDPDYQTAVRGREDSLALEMVRVALRWGTLPGGDATPETLAPAREQFRTEIRGRLTAGNLDRLINEVSRTTFALDQGLLDSFFGTSAPPTPTDGA